MVLAETTHEEALQTEIIRLGYRAEALEEALAKALDLSRVRAERAGYNRRIAQLEARIAEMDTELHSRDREHWRMADQIQALDDALGERDHRIRRMRGSLAWRLGAPIRALENWLA